jgi:hypothetical protein
MSELKNISDKYLNTNRKQRKAKPLFNKQQLNNIINEAKLHKVLFEILRTYYTLSDRTIQNMIAQIINEMRLTQDYNKLNYCL